MTDQFDRVCIYCGNPADSNEHIIATWIVNELERYTGRKILSHTMTSADDVIAGDQSITTQSGSNKKGHPTLEFTTDLICANCNSGWMNVIDEHVRRYMNTLIRGRTIATSGKMRKAMAAWAVKTAITARFAHITPLPVAAEWPKQLMRDKIPSADWIVWISYCVGNRGFWYNQSDFNLAGLTRIFPTTDQPPTDPPVFEHGVLMTLLIGQFCVQVLRLNGEGAPIIPAIGVALQIWPTGPATTWPPAQHLDESNLEVFASRFIGAQMPVVVSGPPNSTDEEPQQSSIFASPTVTPEMLQSDETYALTIGFNCQCGTHTDVRHDTGGPLRDLTLPYTAEVAYVCSGCGTVGGGKFTMLQVPGGQH